MKPEDIKYEPIRQERSAPYWMMHVEQSRTVHNGGVTGAYVAIALGIVLVAGLITGGVLWLM